MAISSADVKHLCKLAALDASDEQCEQLGGELSNILAFVEKLQAVDTSNVEPTSHVHGAINAFRKDIAQPSLPISDAELNAPSFSQGSFRVPRIIES